MNATDQSALNEARLRQGPDHSFNPVVGKADFDRLTQAQAKRLLEMRREQVNKRHK